MREQAAKKKQVYRTDELPRPRYVGLDVMYECLCERDDWKKVQALIHAKKYTVKDSDATYRSINYWTEQGLLDDDREKGSEWRRLSFLDLLWLRVLRELRLFGMPLESLLTAYKTLFSVQGEFFWQFELGTMLCLNTKPTPVFAIFSNDGAAHIETLDTLRYGDEISQHSTPHIRINLNSLCESMAESVKAAMSSVKVLSTSQQNKNLGGSEKRKPSSSAANRKGYACRTRKSTSST